MTNLLALPSETILAGDYKIRRVLGAGGFGITYLADEISLGRKVTIKEYFPADFAARIDDVDAVPRSQNSAADYKWGLDRFIEEAQTLAKFEHTNIVRVFRYFRANKTGYMVLQFEEGKSLRTWLKELNRAPRQAEIDQFLAPLLDALEFIHKRDYLHRDIAPDNIIVRNDKSPVLIDFGSARGDIASQSRTVSALVKPGYSPYEQYSTTTSQQGPWTDIYALGATLYQAVTGKRPPDSPTRVVKDDYIPAREAAIGAFRPAFLSAIDKALQLEPKDRPQSILEWRGPLLAPPEKPMPAKDRIALGLGLKRTPAAVPDVPMATSAAPPPPPDAPQAQGQLLDYIDNLKKPTERAPAGGAAPTRLKTRLAEIAPIPDLPVSPSRHGLGYGPVPLTHKAGTKPAPELRPAPLPVPVAAKTKAEAPVPIPVKKQRASFGSRALFFLRPPWRGLLFKLGVGVGVASLAVAYQNQPSKTPPAQQRTASIKPSLSTTAALPSPTPAAPLEARPLVQLAQHKGPVLTFALQQAGKRLVTVGADGAVKFSDAETGVLARTYSILGPAVPTTGASGLASGIPATAPLVSVAIQANTLYAAHADGVVAVWDLERGERLASTKRLDGSVTLVGIAGEGDRFAAAGPDGKVMLLDRRSAIPPTLSGENHKDAIRAIAYVPDRNGLLSTSDDKTVKFWDLDGLSLKRTYRGHNGPVTALDVAPDNRTFASGAEDGQVRLWSAASTRLVRTLRAHGTRVSAVSFGLNGELLATAASDGTIKIYDTKRGKDVQTIGTKNGAIRALVFSPDGRRLIAASEDGSVRAWDISTIKVAKSE